MPPVVKKSLSLQVYEDLRYRILTQQIVFGQKLTNRDLQLHYGVSSTPIRDAVNALYRDGLVEHPTRMGTRVISFSIEQALDINEVLSILGVSAIRLSSKRGNISKTVARLKFVIEQQEQYIGNDKYYDYDQKFHSVFHDYSGNEQLRKVYMQYHMLHEMLVRCFHRGRDARRVSIEEHKQITDAYANGNFELACDCMRDHYKAAEAILKTVLQ